jgi:hypothetical protein
MTNISDETVQRMVGLVWDIANAGTPNKRYSEHLARAQYLAAELPEPVDPEVLAVREITSELLRYDEPHEFQKILNGERDNTPAFQRALAAFKRVTGGGA